MRRTIQDILVDTRDALNLAQRGLEELLSEDGRQRAAGVRNIVVWGRILTTTLQNLRTLIRKEFDEWYEPYRQTMTADSEFQYLYNLRNQVVKEGNLGVIGSQTHIEYLDSDDITRLTANPPPGAKGFFIGDTWGGSGWQITLPDGSIEKYYVRLPEDIAVTTGLRFLEPTTTKRVEPPDDTIENVCQRYVTFLEQLVDAAEKWFTSLHQVDNTTNVTP